MLQFVLERANYWAIIGLMMVGLYITFQSTNMIKRLVGVSIFQTSVFLFYITLGKVAGGTAPILYGRDAKGHGDDHGAEVAAHNTGAGVSGVEEHATPDAPGEALVGDAIDGAAEAGQQEVIVTPLTVQEHSSDLSFPLEAVGNPGGLQEVYSNPLPHVLILTAIVVGVATLAVGLAIVVRIRECYGSIESDEVRQIDIDMADAQDADDPARGFA